MPDKPLEAKWTDRDDATAAEVIVDFWRKSRDSQLEGQPCDEKDCNGFCALVMGWSACLRCGAVQHFEDVAHG